MTAINGFTVSEIDTNHDSSLYSIGGYSNNFHVTKGVLDKYDCDNSKSLDEQIEESLNSIDIAREIRDDSNNKIYNRIPI